MTAVNFKGTYAIPVFNTQSPVSSNYQNFIKETYPLRKKDESAVYDGSKKELYVTTEKDDRGMNDLTFEKLAAIYGIKVRKLTNDEADNVKKGGISKAEKVSQFVKEALSNGAKNVVKTKDGIKTVVLFDEEGKTVFGVYKFDKNDRLVEELQFFNGKLKGIEKYNNDGQDQKVVIKNANKNRAIGINADILKTVY